LGYVILVSCMSSFCCVFLWSAVLRISCSLWVGMFILVG